MSERIEQDYTWINCPNCAQKLFKAIDEEFTLEIPCNSCKAIYELSSNASGQICYRQVRAPKRKRNQNTQYPNRKK